MTHARSCAGRTAARQPRARCAAPAVCRGRATLPELRAVAIRPGCSPAAGCGASRSCSRSRGCARSRSWPAPAEVQGSLRGRPGSGWAMRRGRPRGCTAPKSSAERARRAACAARRIDRPSHPPAHADASRRARSRVPPDVRARGHGVSLVAAVVVDQLAAHARGGARAAAAAARPGARRPHDPAHRAAAPPPARRARPRPVPSSHARRGRALRRRDRPAHGAATPQVLGAVMAAAELPSSGRAVDPRHDPAGRRRVAGPASRTASSCATSRPRCTVPPPLAGKRSWAPGAPPDEEMWRGVASEQRWAMEVLGLRSGWRSSERT